MNKFELGFVYRFKSKKTGELFEGVYIKRGFGLCNAFSGKHNGRKAHLPEDSIGDIWELLL